MNHSPLKTTTTRKSLKPSHMTGYLTGAVGTAALLNAAQADAAVTAVNFGFGSVINMSSGNFGYAGTPVNGVSTGSYGRIFAFGRNNGSGTSVGLGGFGMGGLYSDSNRRAAFFNDGTVIGGGANGSASNVGYFYKFNGYPNYSIDSLKSFTTYQTNQNIAFRTNANNFGWANVSWDAGSKALTVNSAYVNSTAGDTITVGDTGVSAAPEPSRALLALAGLAGVALRRRRKQAA